MPLFSVIIPTYNRADVLRKALESVFSQEARDFEVIVVDDGSTDETESVVHHFGDRIRFIRQQNRGPGAARNAGMHQATGEYLVFLDSDDFWFPWTLTTYSTIVREHKPSIIAGRLAYFTAEEELQPIVQVPLEPDVFPDYFTASRTGLYCGAGQLVVRRNLAVEVGGFLEERVNSEDHDFVLRLGTAPGFINISAPPLIAYRQHPQSLKGDLAKVYGGGRHLVQMEHADRYPGGVARRHDRRHILSQHLRYIILHLLEGGRRKEAWELYRKTFRWNLSLGRFKFLAGFLFRAAMRGGR